jgi:hypothetical protein
MSVKNKKSPRFFEYKQPGKEEVKKIQIMKEEAENCNILSDSPFKEVRSTILLPKEGVINKNKNLLSNYSRFQTELPQIT